MLPCAVDCSRNSGGLLMSPVGSTRTVIYSIGLVDSLQTRIHGLHNATSQAQSMATQKHRRREFHYIWRGRAPLTGLEEGQYVKEDPGNREKNATLDKIGRVGGGHIDMFKQPTGGASATAQSSALFRWQERHLRFWKVQVSHGDWMFQLPPRVQRYFTWYSLTAIRVTDLFTTPYRLGDLGEPIHTLLPCWMPKPLPPRNQCTSWFTLVPVGGG